MINKPKPLERKVIASPENYFPTSPSLEIVGTFNAGAVEIKNKKGNLENWLLVRVAQTPIQENTNEIKLPYFKIPNKENQELQIGFDKYLKKDIIKETKKDVIILGEKNQEPRYRMKHLSLPMLLKLDSKGNIIERQQKPAIYPSYEYDRFGIEDLRITPFENENFLLTYVVPHRKFGVSTMALMTKDFKDYKTFSTNNTPRPIIPNVKDVAFFPEKVPSPSETSIIKKGEKIYATYIRPNAFKEVSEAGIWISYSPDLIHWGQEHRLTPEDGPTTGSGTPPIKIGNKWLAAYHETRKIKKNQNEYVTKIMMMDAKHPWNNFRSSDILETRKDYRGLLPENGYVEEVVFASGLTINDGIITIYSGIGDKWLAYSRYYAEDLIKFVNPSIKKNYF
ncbi:MAG: hypothetical protein KJ566_01090 [Nanoarchaeota archaeon]|nr:hypothetical protein [Nanoarchaeota archaeon]